MSSVALVMMDNRQPDLNLWLEQHGSKRELNLDAQARLVTMLTAYLNTRYACRHGYTLLFYKLSHPGCAHPIWGMRHPSYCKLTAIGDALAAGYEWVVYLDSDAFIRAPENLATILRKYGNGQAEGGGAGYETPEAFFGWDHPFTLGPNMGFIVLQNTDLIRSMLRTWWNSYAGSFSEVHPFEQRSLQWQVMHLQRFYRRIQTLSLRTMDDSYPDDVVHLDHNAGTKTRIWVMVGAAARLIVDMGGPEAKRMRKHLRLLEHARTGLNKARRRPVIEAVVRAANRDMESEGAHTCHRRVVPFNASDSALRHLWHGAKSPDEDNLEHMLAGMPLQLTNCSSDLIHAPWQTWKLSTEKRTAKGTVCKGLCLAHRFSLQAVPNLCLSLGVTRTPRNPFQLQAQLAACAVVAETPAAMRARLHFNVKSGSIKTTHRVQDFRKGLPEHRTSCGFWPSCSATRLLLPKPCWAALRTNFTACGDEEETVANHLLRGAVDHDSGFAISAAGPVPSSMLNTSGRDRLCLTSWRGFSVENNAAVFLRCPQGAGRRWRSSRLFEWNAVPVHKGRHTTDLSETTGEVVRISPRAAPGLCLSAPPLASPGIHHTR